MSKNNQSLLSVLKSLYSQLSQISLSITQVRLNSYKRESKAPSNITSVLHKQIEDISSQAVTENNKTANNNDDVATQPTEDGKVTKVRNNAAKVENVSGVESEFVKYLKQRRPPSVTQSQLGENLKSRAWEHINTAIRYAKNGDIDTAKLHIDIASTALEEAGDYMSHDDYSALVLQIENYFSEHSK